MDRYEIHNAHKAWVIAQTEVPTDDFVEKIVFSVDKVQGFSGIKDETIYIAFQGSADFRDVLSDIDIFMVDFENGAKVHFGFYKQFRIIMEHIDKIISPIIDVDIENPPDNINELITGNKSPDFARRVIFSGQSLGGAIAIIASYIFKTKYPGINISTVTFGCPRVGNCAFTVAFAQKNIEIKQYIYKNDLIPKLPFKIFGYKDISKPIYFGDYRWNERIFYPIIKLLGNPWNHTPKHYIEEFIL